MSKQAEKSSQDLKSSKDDTKKGEMPDDEKPPLLPCSGTSGTLYVNYIVLPVVILILSVVLVQYTGNQPNKSTSKTAEKNTSKGKAKGVLLTAEEFAKHDGSDSETHVYIAILGRVYDVEKGRRMYEKGSGYNVFAGRDSTPSFVTGVFSREQATDDITGISPEDMMGIKEWMDFYRKEYSYVGKVTGRYYDEHGKPTAALKEAKRLIKEGQKLKDKQKEENVKFPGCNSKWSQGEGSMVWCSRDSAGIHRKWVGVPRQFFKPGAKDPRCVCVRMSGPSSDSGEGSEGNLNHPNLKMYPGCGLLDVSCKI